MSRDPKGPPRIARWLLHVSLAEDDVDTVLGDLEETFEELAQLYSPETATRWYYSQVFRSFFSFLYYSFIWSPIMFKTYVKSAFRSLSANKGLSAINIAGLGGGMAAFVLIVLFVQNELSFDSIHEHRADVYRVLLDAKIGEQEALVATSPAIMAAQFLETFPEIEYATRLDAHSEVLVTVDDEPYYDSNFFEADSSVFDVFTFPLVSGNPATALSKPGTMVISESTAHKYYGDSDPMGRIIRINNRTEYEITGVMADVPHNSYIRPDMLGSFLSNPRASDPEWLNNSFQTYLRVQPGFDSRKLEAKFPDFIRLRVGPHIQQATGMSYDEIISSGFRYDWRLENLGDIYLHSNAQSEGEKRGDIRYLYILGIIALFVLSIACINFMNLATARAANRAREVGIRKALGSDRGQLIRQFLGESISTAALSMVFAFGIVLLVLPYFSVLADAQLSIGPWLIGAVITIALATGLLAGIYPAFVLSRFRPATVLRGSFSKSKQGTFLRSSLVVFQFSISIVLLIGTSVVYKQLDFIRNQNVGFDKEHVVVIPVRPGNSTSSFESLREQLLSDPGVVNVAAAGMIPGPAHQHNMTAFRAEGMDLSDFFLGQEANVSDDYVETMGLQIVAGRNFSREFASDSAGYLVNEAAAARMGFTAEEVVGKMLIRPGDDGADTDDVRVVLGVMKDANFGSVHAGISPMVLGRRSTEIRYVPIRIQPENVESTMAFIGNKWKEWAPEYPFRSFFLDADYQSFYEQEQRLGSLYSYFTVLAILIACLGLFGLASFVTVQRTKEIGVRKVMGASVPEVVILLSKDFTYLVLIACVVAFPVAWYAMDKWLQGFAFATTMGWSVFVVSGLSALVIAWLTVSYHAIKAATSNPVNALRCD